jgi:hypothetical protein
MATHAAFSSSRSIFASSSFSAADQAA